MESYGEQGSLSDVESAFDDVKAAFESNNPEKGPVDSTTLENGLAYFMDPSETAGIWSGLYNTRLINTALVAKFSNKTEIENLVRTVKQGRDQAKQDALKEASQSYAKAFNQAVDGITDAQIRGSLANTLAIVREDMIETARTSGDIIKSGAPMYLAMGRYLGLVHDVTVSDWNGVYSLCRLIGSGVGKIKMGDYKNTSLVSDAAGMTFEQWLDIASGKATADDIAAIKGELEKQATEATEKASKALTGDQDTGFTITQTIDEISVSMKSKFKGRFYTRSLNIPANGGLVLVDTGAAPVLKQKEIREYLKSQLGATFWDFSQNPVEGQPFNTPAWVITGTPDQGGIRKRIAELAR